MRITQKPHASISEIINNSVQSITKKISSFATSIRGLSNSLKTIKSKKSNPSNIINEKTLVTCDNFEKNYKIGDLIYGLDNIRKSYIEDSAFPEEKCNFSQTIDSYVVETLRDTEMISYKEDIYDIFDEKFPEEKKQELKDVRAFLNKEFRHLFMTKEMISSWKEKYPINHWDTYISLENEKKYSSAEMFSNNIFLHDNPHYNAASSIINSRIFVIPYTKMKCKSGLEMAIIDPKVVIHFLLDRIEMNRVIDKETDFTGSELRFAYRNKERLAGKIFFYEKGKQVAPPWEQDPTLWDSYKPKSDKQNVA